MPLEQNQLSAQGSRRLNLTMLAIRDQADRFEGVARGSAKPLRLLAAFQEAEPYLGLPAHAFKLVSWLVKHDDAARLGSRLAAYRLAFGAAPARISWPVGRARVKMLNRVLFEAGIFVIRDNERASATAAAATRRPHHRGLWLRSFAPCVAL